MKDPVVKLKAKTLLLRLYSKYVSGFFYNRKKFHNLEEEELEALLKLSRDDTIIVSSPDKGHGVVIMNKSDYIAKMNVILSDQSKFKKVETDDNIENLTKFQSFLRNLNNTKIRKDKSQPINDAVYEEIRPKCARTAVMYGLPKLHKDGVPLRPILSSYDSFSYLASKWLCTFLEGLRSSPTVIKDTFSLCEFLNKNSNLSRHYMVSLDVSSLFTNIPVDFVIDLILKKCYLSATDKLYGGFTKLQLRKLLTWCTKCTTFIFNGELYQQIDGVAMGSPLAPFLADVFMNWLIDNKSHEYNGKYPVLILRYVDDLLIFFEDEADILPFYSFMNNIHCNIKFADPDKEVHGLIKFLDICIQRTDTGFDLSIFRKFDIQLYTHWTSFVPHKMKKNTLLSILHRACMISSNYNIMHSEFKKIVHIFSKLGYPYGFILNCIQEKLNKMINTGFKSSAKVSDVDTRRLFISLSYLGDVSVQINKELSNFIKNIKIDRKLDLCFVNKTFKVKDMFNFKDKQSLLSRAGVVYRLNCSCGESYIGQSGRNLSKRFAIHEETGCHLKDNPTHSIDYSSPDIIGVESDYYKRAILESLYIQKHNPTLNSDEFSAPLVLFSI